MIISKTLKKLRESSGYTQQQVADVLNIDRSTYTYYEIGKIIPDVNTIIKLAKIFKVSYIDILEDEKNPRMEQLYDIDDNFEKIYTPNILSKEEKQLLIHFRILPDKSREKILNAITTETKKIKHSKRLD